MTNRPLSMLSDGELKHAVDRSWRKHSDYVEEQNRRRRIERYGTLEPDLRSYHVVASIGSIALIVKAQSEEDVEEIVRDALYVGYQNRDQIVIDDWNGVEVDNVEESQLTATD
jgi:transcriptional regulator of NAD metabolism